MPFLTQLLSFIHFLVLLWFCCLRCDCSIEKNKFTFLKTISRNDERNVYQTFPVPKRTNHILTCGAKCVRNENCFGIDLCSGGICRLWNGTYYHYILSNDSNNPCQRYIKVSMLNEVQQPTVNVMETASLSSDVASMRKTITASVAIDGTTPNNVQTTDMLSHSYQTTTNTPDTSGPTDSAVAEEISTKMSIPTQNTTHDMSNLADSSSTEVIPTELPRSTDSKTSDTLTTKTSSPTDISRTDSIITQPSKNTQSITTDTMTPIDSITSNKVSTETTLKEQTTTKTPIIIDFTTTNAPLTETLSFIETTISDAQTTFFPSSVTDSTTRNVKTTEKATNTENINNLLTTKASNTFTSPPNIKSTQSSTVNSYSETTSDIFATEIITSTDSYIDLNPSTNMITKEISEETCIIQQEFSGGVFRDLPCYIDTYSWIVIQRRYEGSVDFYRNWADYKSGFGSLDSEFWLGNDHLHQLTSVFGYTHLKIEIKDFDGVEGYAEYSFSIDDESLQYMIHVSWISGNIDDRLWLTDGASFCTLDQDNDGSKAKVCTTDYHGGWWYSWDAFCTEANPNGLYYHTYTPAKTGIFWFGFGSQSYHTLKGVQMMIRKP